MQHLHDRGETVRGATGVAECGPRRVDDSWFTPRQNVRTLSASLFVGALISTRFAPAVRCLPPAIEVREVTGALDDNVDAKVLPRQPRGVLLRKRAASPCRCRRSRLSPPRLHGRGRTGRAPCRGSPSTKGCRRAPSRSRPRHPRRFAARTGDSDEATDATKTVDADSEGHGGNDSIWRAAGGLVVAMTGRAGGRWSSCGFFPPVGSSSRSYEPAGIEYRKTRDLALAR